MILKQAIERILLKMRKKSRNKTMEVKRFNFLNNTMINIKSKPTIIMYVFSLLLSQAIVLGNNVHFIEIRGKFNDNYLDLSNKNIFLGLLLSFFIFPITLKILSLSETYKFKKTSVNMKSKYWVFGAWIIIFLSWIPYLLTFYPGGIVADGALALEEALQSGMPKNNHWVVLYILVLKLFLIIGSFISTNINVGVFLYVIFESLFFSLICAFVASQVYKVTNSKLVFFLVTIMYSVSGFYALFSMTLWKDGVFGALIVLMSLKLWKLLEKESIQLSAAIKNGFLWLIICFWRTNGVHIIALSILFILLLLRKKGLNLILVGVSVVLISTLIQGPLYDAIGIKKDGFTESLSIPLQQVAAVINQIDSLTPTQEKVLFSLLPKETWISNYSPTLSDDIKFSIVTEYLQMHKSDFFKVWLQLLVPNFNTYVKAYMMQTLGFWQLGVYQGNYYDYWFGIQDISSRGWERVDLFERITGKSIENQLLSRVIYVSSGTMVWLLLFSFSLIFSQHNTGENSKRLLILTPLVATWVIVMISTPIAYAYRYIVMLPIALPILCILPLYRFNQKQN